jgi:hypothetical protein
MPDVSILAGGLALGAFLGLCLHFTFGRRESVAFASVREQRITKRMARQVGCSLGEAVDYVRRELELAPSLPDETVLKRAAYHYTRDLPEPELGRAYRGRTRG